MPDEWQFEFESVYNEIAAILHRIDNNLDYFGNPAGWVPMFSFEVNKLMFETEINHGLEVPTWSKTGRTDPDALD